MPTPVVDGTLPALVAELGLALGAPCRPGEDSPVRAVTVLLMHGQELLGADIQALPTAWLGGGQGSSFPSDAV